MKNDALNVEIKAHADGVGGNKDVAWMIGVVEILSLRHLDVRRQTAVNQRRVNASLFQFARHAVEIFFAECNHGVT